MEEETIKSVLENNKKYSFQTDKLSFKSEDTGSGKKFYVEGYISTADIDVYNDLVTPNALKSMLRQIQEKNITLDYEHEAWRDDNTILPVGRIIEARLDERGLWVRALLNKASPKFKAVWSSIKQKFITAFSIAFKPLKTIMKTIGNAEVRIIEELSLLNVALTGAPVNEGAVMTGFDMKSVMLKAINDMENLEGDTPQDMILVPRSIMEEIRMEKAQEVTAKAEDKKPVDDEEKKKVLSEEETDEEKKACKKSVDAETKDEAEAEPASEPVKEEAEAPAEEPVEEKPAEPEQKSEPTSQMDSLLAEMKSMKEKMEAQEKELKSLKENDILKSPTPEQPALKSEESVGAKSVLEAIR